MAEGPIPFVNAQHSGHEELAGASPVAMNVVVDAKLCVRRRPGIAVYDEAPSVSFDEDGLDGLYETLGGALYATSGPRANRDIYRIQDGVAEPISENSAGRFRGLGRPVFAETERLLVFAAGHYPHRILLGSDAPAKLGGSPPKATHVVAHTQRLVVNDADVDRTKVQYSGLAQGTTTSAGHETWPSDDALQAGFLTAEARPDPTVAVAENTNELLLFGSTTTQVMVPDPTFVFAPAGTIDYGCAAPYSIIRDEDTLYWLDHRRRFIQSSGRGATVISAPVQQALNELERVSDCFGYRVQTGPMDALVWTFPSDGITLVFQKEGGWGQWQGRAAQNDRWQQFKVAAHCRRQDGTNVVATLDGRIGKLEWGEPTDLGTPVSAHVVTGYIDRGTDKKKACECLRFTLRRGGSGSQIAWFGWRDRPGAWEATIPIDLGAYRDTEPVVEFRSLGVYRRRQWFFQFSDTATLALVSAVEQYEVLDT